MVTLVGFISNPERRSIMKKFCLTLVLLVFAFMTVAAHAEEKGYEGKELLVVTKNDEFKNGLEGWKVIKDGPGETSVTVEKVDGANVVHLKRLNTHKQRGYIGIAQTFDPPFPAKDTASVSIKGMILMHKLKNSGKWSKKEGELGSYPLHVYFYTDEGLVYNIGILTRDNRPGYPINYIRKDPHVWFYYDSEPIVTHGKKIKRIEVRAEGYDVDVMVKTLRVLTVDLWDKNPVSGSVSIEEE